jgi:hypothetical protein
MDAHAGVTQLAECLLPKQNVVGSNPITRSILTTPPPTTLLPPGGWLRLRGSDPELGATLDMYEDEYDE